MARLQLSFLGSFHVALGGQPIRTFRSAKVRALLAYLAIEADKPHQREALAGLLWPDEPQEIARQNLRQSLYHLREALNQGPGIRSQESEADDQRPVTSDQSPFLLVTRPAVQFNRHSDQWLDVAEFLTRLDQGQLEPAVALYRGDLLKGLYVPDSTLFDEWLVVTRERLHHLALDALYQLAQRYQDQGQWTKAQAYAQQQLALEPWREEAYRQLMQVLALSGQRSAALAQYDLCRRSLEEELGVEPAAETTAVYERIKAEELGPVARDSWSGERGPWIDRGIMNHETGLTRLVGRDNERAELQRRFESARRGRGRLLCVSGEPGIGKTALVEAFLSDLVRSGPACVMARGQCSERLTGAEAYLPWLEALDSLLHGPGSEWMARVMKLLAPTWYRHAASLALDEASAARLAERAAVSPERLKRELVALLQELSRLQPLVVFLDDLHWADASTIDVLGYVGLKPATMRLLLVTAYRPSELLLAKHPFVQVQLELQGRGVCQEMPLGFLSRDDVERYLTLEFAHHQFPKELASLIHRQTEGNPLFVVDLVQDLRDRRVIAEVHGHWRLAGSIPEVDRELPPSVRSLIQRKLDRLSPTDHRLLVAASVQGYEFDSAVVANALRMDAAKVEERLDALERVHAFVRLVREDELPDRTPTQQYQFVHVLYQNALSATLRPTRRARLSRAVAEALLECYGGPSGAVASELAHLFEAARERPRAAEYYALAARQALEVFAFKEAVTLSRRGLEMLRPLPDTPARAQ